MAFDGFSVRDEVFDWVFEAERDVERARKLFELGDYSMVCFLSQQAIERALRAVVMALLRESPPRVHDLTVLYSMVRGILDLGERAELLPEISQYYVTARYPNAGLRRPSTSFSRLQAERALGVAVYVVERVKEAVATRRG